MALASLLTDRKFLYFKHLLQVGDREALSYLDWMWLQLNISGCPTYQNADELECSLQWEGKRGHLVKHLVAAGFLKRSGKTKLHIPEWESRMMDWGKKRLYRRQEDEKRAADGRRTKNAERTPYDLDSTIPFPKQRVKPVDHDQGQVEDRDRRKTATKTQGKSLKNPQQGAQELLSALQSGLGGVGDRQKQPKAPSPTQPIGSYSARECALAAAAMEKDLDPNQARAMWLTRAAEVSYYSGGLDFMRDLLAQVVNSQIAGNPKGVGTVRHPGRVLNARTHEFLEERRAS